jgi:plasmid stabilization system protein ParE
MTGFRLAPDARTDIQEIWSYIADASLDAAGRVRRALLNSCRQLAKHPLIGHRRADLTTRGDVLFWPVYSYMIIYRPATQPLEIVRVLHAKRDVRSVLR